MKRMISTSMILLMLVAIMPSTTAQSNTSAGIVAYNGLIGADSPLYSIKLYAEKIEIYITTDNNEKLKKEIAYAERRLSEARAAIQANNSAAIDVAMNEYSNELIEINNTLVSGNADSNAYAEVSPELGLCQRTTSDMANNSTVPQQSRGSIENANDNTLKLMNGNSLARLNGAIYINGQSQMNNSNDAYLANVNTSASGSVSGARLGLNASSNVSSGAGNNSAGIGISGDIKL